MDNIIWVSEHLLCIVANVANGWNVVQVEVVIVGISIITKECMPKQRVASRQLHFWHSILPPSQPGTYWFDASCTRLFSSGWEFFNSFNNSCSTSTYISFSVSSSSTQIIINLFHPKFSTSSPYPCWPEHPEFRANFETACEGIRSTKGIYKNQTRCQWSRTKKIERRAHCSPVKASPGAHWACRSPCEENHVHRQARWHIQALQSPKGREYRERKAPCKGNRN